MSLDRNTNGIITKPNRECINRRAFLAKSLGCAAGLSLIGLPEVLAGVSAAGIHKSQEEIFKELDEKVDKFLPMYRSCALTSFAALNEQFELNTDEKTLRALMPFTGGIGGKGETCGAVSGSLLALGFLMQTPNEKSSAPSAYESGGLFFDGFEKKFGSTRCREVINHQYGRYYDFQDPEEKTLFMKESQKTGKCAEVIKNATHVAAAIFLENA